MFLKGYFLIVSHLNACNAEGMSWVNKVLVTGLNEGDNLCNWKIEVHGSSTDQIDLIGDSPNCGEPNENGDRSTTGPAVYIIQKDTVEKNGNGSQVKVDNEGMEKNSKGEVTNVKIKFFGY